MLEIFIMLEYPPQQQKAVSAATIIIYLVFVNISTLVPSFKFTTLHHKKTFVSTANVHAFKNILCFQWFSIASPATPVRSHWFPQVPNPRTLASHSYQAQRAMIQDSNVERK